MTLRRSKKKQYDDANCEAKNYMKNQNEDDDEGKVKCRRDEIGGGGDGKFKKAFDT